MAQAAVSVATIALNVGISDTNPHASLWINALNYNYAGVVLATTGTLVGTWKVEVSNDDGKTSADITSAFTPTIAAVASSPNGQYAQMVPIVAKAIRLTFTASSGSGSASAAVALKSSSS
jgi:hypothetical protein